ncbi:hypothetical protein ACCO45_005115 [Purpureocillium lilacinum]|uniref:Uncharacterized protein n=1 Tax=Purpureocillium lilacinum TaxID=33203 RepID=A0ACC4DV73_PURLI
MKISIATLALIQGLALATPMGTRTSRSVARIEQRNAAPTTTGAAPTNPAEVPDTAISHNKESDRVGSGNKLADDELADDEITDNELPDDELSDDTRSSSHPSPHSTETSNPDSEADSPFYFRGRHPFDKGEDTDDEIPELPAFDRGKIKVNEALTDGVPNNELSQSKPPQNKLPRSELSDSKPPTTIAEITNVP